MVFSKAEGNREKGKAFQSLIHHSWAGQSPFKQSQFAQYFELSNPCFLKIVLSCPCIAVDFVIFPELSYWYVVKAISQGAGQLPQPRRHSVWAVTLLEVF